MPKKGCTHYAYIFYRGLAAKRVLNLLGKRGNQVEKETEKYFKGG